MWSALTRETCPVLEGNTGDVCEHVNSALEM